MTTENNQYGGGWVRCSRCTVHDAIAKMAWNKGTNAYEHIDAKQCGAWIIELAEKGLMAGVDATKRRLR